MRVEYYIDNILITELYTIVLSRILTFIVEAKNQNFFE